MKRQRVAFLLLVCLVSRACADSSGSSSGEETAEDIDEQNLVLIGPEAERESALRMLRKIAADGVIEAAELEAYRQEQDDPGEPKTELSEEERLLQLFNKRKHLLRKIVPGKDGSAAGESAAGQPDVTTEMSELVRRKKHALRQLFDASDRKLPIIYNRNSEIFQKWLRDRERQEQELAASEEASKEEEAAASAAAGAQQDDDLPPKKRDSESQLPGALFLEDLGEGIAPPSKNEQRQNGVFIPVPSGVPSPATTTAPPTTIAPTATPTPYPVLPVTPSIYIRPKSQPLRPLEPTEAPDPVVEEEIAFEIPPSHLSSPYPYSESADPAYVPREDHIPIHVYTEQPQVEIPADSYVPAGEGADIYGFPSEKKHLPLHGHFVDTLSPDEDVHSSLDRPEVAPTHEPAMLRDVYELDGVLWRQSEKEAEQDSRPYQEIPYSTPGYREEALAYPSFPEGDNSLEVIPPVEPLYYSSVVTEASHFLTEEPRPEDREPPSEIRFSYEPEPIERPHAPYEEAPPTPATESQVYYKPYPDAPRGYQKPEEYRPEPVVISPEVGYVEHHRPEPPPPPPPPVTYQKDVVAPVSTTTYYKPIDPAHAGVYFKPIEDIPLSRPPPMHQSSFFKPLKKPSPPFKPLLDLLTGGGSKKHHRRPKLLPQPPTRVIHHPAALHGSFQPPHRPRNLPSGHRPPQPTNNNVFRPVSSSAQQLRDLDASGASEVPHLFYHKSPYEGGGQSKPVRFPST